MRPSSFFRLCASLTFVIGAATTALAQTPNADDPPTTPGNRQSIHDTAAAEKAQNLAPYPVTFAEKVMTRIEARFTGTEPIYWHPFLQNAYQGGGFAAGVGHMFHPSSYSTLDVRASYSIRDYKLGEAEYILPRLFDRHAELTVTGGWRDATQVAFYGIGPDSSDANRTNFGFEQPFGSALLTYRPTRELFLIRGGFEASRWDLKSGSGLYTSTDDIYTPEQLPGLGAKTTFYHSQATVGFDSRASSLYARRGGFYGVTGHDFKDRDNNFGYQQVDYEAIQHIPILRESWVLSLHGVAKTSWRKGDQTTPFYALPSLGSGNTLRGYSGFRFRDNNSLLMQAEWRIMANRFFEGAVFYDTGKVAANKSDLDFNHLKHDVGFGVRFHGPLSTVLRVDVAHSNEGTRLAFATGPSF